MNIVDRYRGHVYQVQDEYMLIKIIKESETPDVWYNRHVEEIFVCTKTNMDGYLMYVVIDPHHRFYPEKCYIANIKETVYENLQYCSDKPINWSDFIDYQKSL